MAKSTRRVITAIRFVPAHVYVVVCPWLVTLALIVNVAAPETFTVG